MNKKTFVTKSNGDSLNASEWNELTGYTNEIVDAINDGGSEGLPNMYINSKGNLNIETSAEIGNTQKGKINIESMDDIQLKPGDDIILYSHHRPVDKQDEVAIKVTDGNDIPVKLQVNAAEMTITTKDKSGSDAEVFDLNINSGKNTKGYLKLRARAIDLRCEDHGGVAIQPKGQDSSHKENKIKFEHGGGDGLEFGTFNTQKTSVFTDEYRFNKNGVWKMATRQTETSDKYDGSDETTHYKYVKQSDDFYDIVDDTDEQATTEDIIKTAYAMNGAKCLHTHITQDGDLEIESVLKYSATVISSDSDPITTPKAVENLLPEGLYTAEQINTWLSESFIIDESVSSCWVRTPESGVSYEYEFRKISPNINIESGNKLKLKGILDFGSSFNFGETDEGIEVQYKYTKKGNRKDCGMLRVVAVNNHPTDSFVLDGETIPPGETMSTSNWECSILDIIKLTKYMKANNMGPWVQ